MPDINTVNNPLDRILSSDKKQIEVLDKIEDIINRPSNKNQIEDIINHPSHYKSETGLEVIDVIKAFTADLKGIEAVDTGNIIKYICRWNKKNGVQDLKKAMWYLQHLIDYVDKNEKENKNDEN